MSGKHGSPGYKFTTSDFDDPRIENLKELAKAMNEAEKDHEKAFGLPRKSNYYGDYETRTRYYVWCRGRGTRTDPEKIRAYQDVWKQKYGREINPRYAKARLAQDLPLWMAEKCAVYLMKRRVHKELSPKEMQVGKIFSN